LADFFFLQFGFVILWQKNVGAKSAHKMKVKLIQGVYEGENKEDGKNDFSVHAD